MKYHRLNQIAMAVLGALLLFFGARTIVNIAYEEHETKPGYEVAGTEEKPAEGDEKPASQLATLLASADPARGEDVFKKCAICHTADKGGANLIGPNLYGVLGRKIASHEGYEYSDALKGKEGDWDYEKIDHMIENPNAFAPGTKMALFPGLPDAKQRADVIAFLRTKNDNPPPLPEAAEDKPAEEKPAEEKPAEEKPAEGGAEILPLLATADAKQGEADAALCKVCHTFDKGGATLVGPNLYDIVGHKIASKEGFNYSPALKAHGGDWTYQNLDVWLTNPQAFAAGTTMAFPGVPDIKKRANIIAFLRSNSDNPVPLPEAAAPAEEKAEPAEAKPEEPAAEPEAKPEEPAAEPEAPAAAEPEEPTAEPEAPAPEPEAPAVEPEAPATAEPEAPAAEPEAPAAEPEAPAAAEPEAPAAAGPEMQAEDPEASWTPHKGEPPSANQPQPVVPEEMQKVLEETEDNPPSESTAGEPPSPSQPEPVYPEGKPEGLE
jgi:cytochrome c